LSSTDDVRPSSSRCSIQINGRAQVTNLLIQSSERFGNSQRLSTQSVAARADDRRSTETQLVAAIRIHLAAYRGADCTSGYSSGKTRSPLIARVIPLPAEENDESEACILSVASNETRSGLRLNDDARESSESASESLSEVSSLFSPGEG